MGREVLEGRAPHWAWVCIALLSACGGASAGQQAAGQTVASPEREAPPAPTLDAASAPTMDKLAVAAGCVTQGPEPAEVIAWRKRQHAVVASNLSTAAGCFSKTQQAAYLQVGLESQTNTSSNVWISASTVNDCTVTQCVVDKLRSTVLPAPPAALPSTASHAVQVNLTFEPARSPALQLGATPDVPAGDSPCIDRSRLPKSGQLSAAHIQSQVRAQAFQQRKCYEQGLARDRSLTGRVVIRFVIAVDGAVQSVEVKSNSLPDCQVVGCVSDVFRMLRFDAPQGGPVTVEYPVVFQPVE